MPEEVPPEVLLVIVAFFTYFFALLPIVPVALPPVAVSLFTYPSVDTEALPVTVPDFVPLPVIEK